MATFEQPSSQPDKSQQPEQEQLSERQFMATPHVVEQAMYGLPTIQPTDEALAKDLNLSPGEDLLCVINRHPIGLVQFYIGLAAGSIGVLAFLYFFISNKSTIGLSAVPDYIGILVASLLIIVLALVNTTAIKIYKMNKLVLTTESLIVEQQRGLFNSHRKSLSLEAIEDVSYDQNGIMQRIFGYATIKVATIGKDSVKFAMAKDPKQYADYIVNAREQLIKKQQTR